MKARLTEILGFSKIGTGEVDYGKGVVRVAPKLSETIGVRGRHDLVHVKNLQNGNSMVAALRMSTKVAANQVAMEYDQRRALGAAKGASELEIQRASLISWWTFFWWHPAIEFRLMARMTIIIAILSLLLGAVLGIAVSNL
jgi:hypothetical protein